MIPAFIASVEVMLERWRQHDGKEIELFHEFKILTSEMISRTAFGSSYLEGQHIFDIVVRNNFKITIPVSMIINESRRLYCPAVQIARIVHKEVGLGKFILPANTEIVVPIGAVHHSPGIWGEDASHFKPERSDYSQRIFVLVSNKYIKWMSKKSMEMCHMLNASPMNPLTVLEMETNEGISLNKTKTLC
ncbi:hypothetical protein NC651_036075 [Populus alba x Populus x berolinensis]|nr:hypothetical protein NC651_036075 [Populus alba x Populus x berolinensis]